MKYSMAKIISLFLISISFIFFNTASIASADKDKKYSYQEDKYDEDKIYIKSVQVDLANSQIIVNGLNMDDGG